MPAGQKPSSAAALPEATGKYSSPNFGFFSSFDLPFTREALAVRIRKNLTSFGLFYVMVWWVGLAISLVPRWRTSNLILLLMTLVIESYLTLPMLKPNTKFGPCTTVAAMVMFALAVVSTVTLVFIEAKIHLLLSLAIGVPAVFVHAILWRDDLNSTSR